MKVNKINSILQFVTLGNGQKITLVTNPHQPFTSKKNIGSKYPFTIWQYGDSHYTTQALIQSTSIQYPFIKKIKYV